MREDGLLTRVTDPTGRCTALDYDAFGDVVAVTNGAGERTRLERDGAERVTTSINLSCPWFGAFQTKQTPARL